ncbi:MAG: ribosomal protein S18-alanine N-acetyltransferase [Firmicutes bacterium]|nr:ribosomal protein S18-alanine N-acetyltransferase [Bacillota bacterium]
MNLVRRMNGEDIDAVFEIEKSCFKKAWTRADFEREIYENKMALYYVAEKDGRVVGFAGMWHVVNEGQITNIALLAEARGLGLGKMLMEALFAEAERLEMIGISLEVAVGNEKARALYSSMGFEQEGIRKGYYEDTHEDAVLMWKNFDISSEEDDERGISER